MHKAVARVKAAIESGEKIAVFGDYDVDGSSSSALLNDFLTCARAAAAHLHSRPPDGRLRPFAARDAAIARRGCEPRHHRRLRCGRDERAGSRARRGPRRRRARSSRGGARAARLCARQSQSARRHIRPRLSLRGRRDVSLRRRAQSRACATAAGTRRKASPNPICAQRVDLVGLATICDVVPLVGVNRAFVRAGLARIAAGARPGLAALAAVAGAAAPFTPHHLGFVLGPQDQRRRPRRTLQRWARSFCRPRTSPRPNRWRGCSTPTTASARRSRRLSLKRLWNWPRRQAGRAVPAGGRRRLALRRGRASWPGGSRTASTSPPSWQGFEGGLGRGSARSVVGVDVGAADPRRPSGGRSGGWRRPRHGGRLLADGGAARSRSGRSWRAGSPSRRFRR